MPGIDRFYAVTRSGSLYLVTSEKDKKGTPTVEKIAAKEGAESAVMTIGMRLRNGRLVGVMRMGILLYHPGAGASERRPETVNTRRNWGGSTSEIIGLFLNEEDARGCLCSENPTVLDRRWADKTREVLTAIGDSHPIFVICRSPKEYSFDEIP